MEEMEKEKLLFKVFSKMILLVWWRTHQKILQNEEEARKGQVGKSFQRDTFFLARFTARQQEVQKEV
eukprot:10961067-Ditylum_brightwellii.AAC.1